MNNELGGNAMLGTLMHTPVLGEVHIVEDALVVVDETGTITEVLTGRDPGYDARARSLDAAGKLRRLGSTEYLLPGLIDLHNHAPQWPQIGKALHLPLEDWLGGHTFPLEARYADPEFAAEVYTSLVDAMLGNGTTTAMYFGTLHLEATKTLADVCLEKGQRSLVGKVAMDNPETCPPFYRDRSATAGLEETRELVDYIIGHPRNTASLVHPVVTPRFIPSCTDDLLAGLGDIAAAFECHVQTHCSESDWAHDYGLSRFAATDTETYREFGLLTRKTVLAHANLIGESDMTIIERHGAAIAHCPLSNFYFANAVFPTREALDRDVHCGLGTDISGGPSPSIFNSIAAAVVASRVRQDGVDASVPAKRRGAPDAAITIFEAFWMATVGGGIALDLPIGQFAAGYAFDAIVIDVAVPDTNLVIWPGLDSPEDVFQKIVYNAGRQDVREVWVGGRPLIQHY